MALVAFNSAAHNKPVLIADLLDSLLPILYRKTKVRVSQVHTHTHTRTHTHTMIDSWSMNNVDLIVLKCALYSML